METILKNSDGLQKPSLSWKKINKKSCQVRINLLLCFFLTYMIVPEVQDFLATFSWDKFLRPEIFAGVSVNWMRS